MDNRYIASEIKNRLKMADVLERYGIQVNRQHRIPCPLHGGTDANCGVRDRYIYCFVCNESADAIGFVQRYFNLSFMEAIAKINEDFNLGLPIGERLDRRQREEISKRAFLAKMERERAEAEKKRIKDEYELALGEYIRLDRQKRRFAPKKYFEDLHPLFVEAIMELSKAEYRLDEAEVRLYLYETRNRCNT